MIQRSDSGSVDAHGNDVPTVVNVETVCELQQRLPSERTDSGEISDDEWRVFFLPAEDLSTADAVQVDGEVFEFTGDPWPAYNPRTKVTSHIEVKARRTAGADDGS